MLCSLFNGETDNGLVQFTGDPKLLELQVGDRLCAADPPPPPPPPSKAVITELRQDTGNVQDAKHIIMFDNLPATIDETELRKNLEGFGNIALVKVIKKGSSCTAFARVADLEMAVWIVSTLHESLVDGMPMRVWLKK